MHEDLVEGLSALSIATETQNLVDRCNQLLREVTEFADYLKVKRKLLRVEHRHFRREIQTDLKTLERWNRTLSSQVDGQDEQQPDPHIYHAVKSSNLPFLEAVWTAAKQSRDVVELKRTGQLVDVVTNGGLRWIKVSTITESRLLMEMANKGWEWQDQDSEEDGSSDDGDSQSALGAFDDDDIGLSLVNMARSLSESARRTRIQYKHPSVELILTRIQEGKSKDIDKVLTTIRSLGVQVICKSEPSGSIPLDLPTMQRMVPEDWETFTEVLNIDCTILLALVSDISHQDINEQAWFNRAIKRQIEIENEEQLLPAILWPALAGRRLVCTQEAARRMQEIVDTIGTETERARTQYIMGKDVPMDTVLSDLQKLSKHTIPPNIHLPIETLHYTYDPSSTSPHPAQVSNIPLTTTHFPPSANKIATKLSDINSSVFFFGWAANIMTVTSNKTTARQIESLVEEFREADDEVGPRVWICPISRSLIAKEKERSTSNRSLRVFKNTKIRH